MKFSTLTKHKANTSTLLAAESSTVLPTLCTKSTNSVLQQQQQQQQQRHQHHLIFTLMLDLCSISMVLAVLEDRIEWTDGWTRRLIIEGNTLEEDFDVLRNLTVTSQN